MCDVGIINSEMGSLNSWTTMEQPSSPIESISESKTTLPSSEFKHNPSNLTFSALTFEVVDGDVEVQSPDNSLWESFFSDQLEGEFMISSPVRNTPSPGRRASNCNNYNYGQAMHARSLLVCSPPPRTSSPLITSSSSCSTHKGKGQSPLHKVFNSPNNQYMQLESLSLPALENFLDDYDRDDDFIWYNSTLKTPGVGSSSACFDKPTTVPALLDCLTSPNSSRFGGSSTETLINQGSLQLNQTSDIYQMVSIVTNAPLSEQLRQERQKEKQHQQPHTVALSLGPEQEQDSGLQLVHLLLSCAEAVAKDDYMLGRRYLHHLNRVVTPLGNSMQRVAYCFAEALSARIAATLTARPNSYTSSKPFTPLPPNSLEILKIYQILYQAFPYVKFAHFTANQAIYEAFEAEERVHVIDLDILQGYQWPAFMQALAARPGGPPFLRITGVGPSPELVRETGRCLTELAHSFHVPFEFHSIGEQLEDLKPHMFNRCVGEALAVNSVNRLHRVPVGNCLGNLLTMIRDQAPNIVTIIEQEASHNGPYFLGRFLEALHYYSAIFDSLDSTFPAASVQREKVEQYIFAREIRNIVACEGPERVIRHERLEQWRKIMEGKYFKQVPLSPNAVTQSKILLGLYSCDDYRLTEDKGCLLLGWQDRTILAASAWRC